MNNCGFEWMGGLHGDWYWLYRIFRELGYYYDKSIEDIADIPFNYVERSIVGQIAIAAHECGYYTLQDYSTNINIENEGGKPEYRYPDLWLTREPEKEEDYLFEAKRLTYPLTENLNTKAIKNSVCETIKSEVKNKFNTPKTPQIEEVGYQCTLVFIQLCCNEEQWGKYKEKPSSYDKTLEKIIDDINKSDWPDDTVKPNFCFYYWIKFDKLNSKPLSTYYWNNPNERKQYTNPALGFLIFGSFQEVHKPK